MLECFITPPDIWAQHLLHELPDGVSNYCSNVKIKVTLATAKSFLYAYFTKKGHVMTNKYTWLHGDNIKQLISSGHTKILSEFLLLQTERKTLETIHQIWTTRTKQITECARHGHRNIHWLVLFLIKNVQQVESGSCQACWNFNNHTPRTQSFFYCFK